MAEATSTPVWFGPGGHRRLFGWLHHPPNMQARAGVVLCPPLGAERISAHDTYRLLAEALVEEAMVALRFDYLGTGDSTGNLGSPDGVGAWLDDIRAAVDYLRDRDVRHIAIVGMRMGATLAAFEVKRGGALDAMVLWDPCLSGRSFLRQQGALYDVMFGAGASAGAETPGFVYPDPLRGEIADLDLGHAPAHLAERTLVLTRTHGGRGLDSLPFAGGSTDMEGVAGQPELLDISTLESEIPVVAIERVARWLSGAVPPQPVVLALEPPTDRSAFSEQGSALVERAAWLGPHPLFAMATEPDGPAAGPVVIFLNAATEPHLGPARQWVELSRRLAESGVRSLRMDLSGLGESPARPGQAAPPLYTPQASEDVIEVARAVCPDDPGNVVLVGLCSGAFTALEAGRVLGARGVVAINPVLDVLPSASPAKGWMATTIARPRSRIGTALARNSWIKSVLMRLPQRAWWLAHLLRLQRSPADGLRDVAARVGSTLIICNEYDAQPYFRRGKWIVDALARSGSVRFEVIGGIDHGLLTSASRGITADLIVAYVVAGYGPPLALPVSSR